MAKKSRGRLRVFFAEFEGDDDTIQEGLRAVSSAVGRTFQPKTVVKYLPADRGLDDGELEEVVQEAIEEDEDVIDAPAQRRSRPKRKPPTMSFVKDLDLHPDGKVHFRDFYEGKNPSSQMEQVAVCVYYLRRILEVDGVTAHHVYTCLKRADARVPRDLPQIIRNTANKKGWVDTSDANALDITHPGENYVEHDLPRNGD